ncbi:MAG: hypothetical protein ACJ76L_00690 [Conexibacter sp.]
MTASRIVTLSVTGALALGMAACGGSGSDDAGGSTASPAATTAADATTTSATTTETTTAADAGGAGGARLTPPGTKLGFGEQATAAWVPPSDFSVTGAQKGYRLVISVDSIERGTIDDLKNIQLDADQRRSTPYYVKVTVKALEDVKVGADDPDVTFDAIDDRGQEQGNVIFIGEFPRCDDTQVPRPFSSGKSFESCLTYLVPGGGSIDEVRWGSGPSRKNENTPYYDKPIVWSGS